MFNDWPRCIDYLLNMDMIKMYFTCFKGNSTEYSNALALRIKHDALKHALIHCTYDANTLVLWNRTDI